MICPRCGEEVGNLYCGKCRAEIEVEAKTHVPSGDMMVLLAYDKKKGLYYYGCNVDECPCNMKNGWCSKATIYLDKNMLHEFDGDNAVKQWCG